MWRSATIKLDASPLEYVSEAQILEWVKEWAVENSSTSKVEKVSSLARWQVFSGRNIVEREYTVTA